MNSRHIPSVRTKKAEAQKYLEAGTGAFKRGHYPTSIEHYTTSIKLNATVAAYANRAQAHLMLESYDDAIRDAQSALSMPSDSIRDAQSALNMDPSHFKARYRLGRAFFCKHMYEEAMKHYEKCLAAEPKNAQVLQAVEQCKKAMANSTDASGSTTSRAAETIVTGPSSSSGSNVVEPIKFAHKSLFIHPDSLRLNLYKHKTLDHLLDVLTSPTSLAPIAQIVLSNINLDIDLGKFFASLDPILLEGGDLEFHNARGDDNAFRQFIRPFKPKSIKCFSDDRANEQLGLIWNFDAHMRYLDPVRNAKQLELYPLCSRAQNSVLLDRLFFVNLSQQTVVDWLHSPLASPSHCSAAWNPPKPAKEARFVDVQPGLNEMKLNPLSEVADLCRHPADKLLSFAEAGLIELLGEEANVDTLIDLCYKRFRLATRPLNYSVKVTHQIDMSKPPIMPRDFTNTLGEQLRVSVQHINMETSFDPDYGLFPPYDLVIIERFHTS